MNELNKKWYQTKDNKNIFMIVIMLILPIVTSIISTWHVVDFMLLANYKIMAIVLAGTFEAGLLAALASMQVMRILETKWPIYIIFILLTFYQLIGNIYYGYNYISINLITDPNWIKNFVELFEFVHDPEDIKGWKRIISVVAGSILPIISMIFLHLNMEYILKEEKKEVEKKEDLQLSKEESKVEEKEIEKKKEQSETENKLIEIEEPELVEEKVLTEEEINEVELHREENKNQISDIKEELDKNISENVYFKLLSVLFNKGIAVAGDKLPEWEELLERISKIQLSVTDNEIKQFLVLCTVIKIVDMNDKDHRVFKKNYNQAKEILEKVLKTE